MTATDITEDYLLSLDGFATWCELWEAGKRCPFAFPDWLRDRELNDAADVAAWAYREEKWPGYTKDELEKEGDRDGSIWWNFSLFDSFLEPDDIDPGILIRKYRDQFRLFRSTVAAIAWLLVNVDLEKLGK